MTSCIYEYRNAETLASLFWTRARGACPISRWNRYAVLSAAAKARAGQGRCAPVGTCTPDQKSGHMQHSCAGRHRSCPNYYNPRSLRDGWSSGLRPSSQRVLAAVLIDGDVIDAGQAPTHQATLIELPVLVAVGAEPISAVIMPLIGESHRDTIVVKSPEFLDQAIIEFSIPFPNKERDDRIAAEQKLTPISPRAVGSIRSATRPGSRVFHASSARRTFCAALSR